MHCNKSHGHISTQQAEGTAAGSLEGIAARTGDTPQVDKMHRIVGCSVPECKVKRSFGSPAQEQKRAAGGTGSAWVLTLREAEVAVAEHVC